MVLVLLFITQWVWFTLTDVVSSIELPGKQETIWNPMRLLPNQFVQ